MWDSTSYQITQLSVLQPSAVLERLLYQDERRETGLTLGEAVYRIQLNDLSQQPETILLTCIPHFVEWVIG